MKKNKKTMKTMIIVFATIVALLSISSHARADSWSMAGNIAVGRNISVEGIWVYPGGEAPAVKLSSYPPGFSENACSGVSRLVWLAKGPGVDSPGSKSLLALATAAKMTSNPLYSIAFYTEGPDTCYVDSLVY